MVGYFEVWTTVNGSDAKLSGNYILSSGRKETLMSPAEEPEIDYADLELEAYSLKGEEITVTDSAEIDQIVDWDNVSQQVEKIANDQAEAEYYGDM